MTMTEEKLKNLKDFRIQCDLSSLRISLRTVEVFIMHHLTYTENGETQLNLNNKEISELLNIIHRAFEKKK